MSTRLTPIVAGFVLGAAVLAAAGPGRAARLSSEDVRARVVSLSPALQLEISGLQYLLDDDDLADLLDAPSNQRCRRWIDRYWRDRDPIYTTDVNEARVAHERRVSEARDRYYCEHWPGWDERGEVLIRYGEPDWRQTSGEDVTAAKHTSAVEVWGYNDLDMIVPFEDANNSGYYTYYLEHVYNTDRPRLNIPSEFLGTLNMAGQTVDKSRAQDLPGTSINLDAEAAGRKLFNFQEVLQTQPAVYAFDYKNKRIPMAFSVDRFRGGDGVDRLEVSVEFLANAVVGAGTGAAAVGAAGAGAATHEYVTTAVFHDVEGKLARRDHESVDVASGGRKWMLSQVILTLPPGFYHAGVTIAETGTGRFTSYRRDVTVEDFDSGFAMSDVVLASNIGAASDTSSFNRGAITIMAHPLRRYPRGADVPIYFEVYHLSPGRSGVYHYTVEYRLTPRTPKPAGFIDRLFHDRDSGFTVSSRFPSSSRGPRDVAHLSIGTRNLWPGDYGLEVIVTDDVSHATATRTTSFHLFDADEAAAP